MFSYYKKLPQIKNEKAMNTSFNERGLSNPHECGFYAAHVGTDFFLSNNDFTLESFFSYQIKWLKEEKNIDIKSFLRNRLDSWDDDQFSDKEKVKYIFELFFKRTFDGIYQEKLFFDFLKPKCFSIRHATNYEDLKYHFDFAVNNINKTNIYVQLKPKSFIGGIKRGYIQRALNLMMGSNKPLFIVLYDEKRLNDYKVVLRKKSGGIKMVPFLEFFLSKMDQKTIQYLSDKTFKEIKVSMNS